MLDTCFSLEEKQKVAPRLTTKVVATKVVGHKPIKRDFRQR